MTFYYFCKIFVPRSEGPPLINVKLGCYKTNEKLSNSVTESVPAPSVHSSNNDNSYSRSVNTYFLLLLFVGKPIPIGKK